MKKIICLVSSIVLLMLSCITASAAGHGALNGGTSVIVGNNIEFTVNVNGCQNATSVAVAVNCDNDFEIVSGTWLKSGSLSNFDLAKGKGALSGLASPDINGNLFKLVLKGIAASTTAQGVSVNVIAKNGSNEIMNITLTKSVKIGCKYHHYGNYTKKDNNKHTRTCSVCGNVETGAHNWNGGKVTKSATCKEAGIKTLTCTSCSASKTETIAKTNNHTWGNYVETKKPTCSAAGTSTRNCSTCGKNESKQINATGHSFGGWKTTKQPTCETKGTQARSCSKCSRTEIKELAALGHNFKNPTVTKQPTCTETGIETGKCTRCNKESSNTVKATGHKFGNWEKTKEATCKAAGEEVRKCSACKATETRKVEALGHDFKNPVIVKEATISSTGLKEGKCKRCGETTTEVIPCTAKDEATGTAFETKEGTFAAGTEIKIAKLNTESSKFAAAQAALKEICSDFTLYDIGAELKGAAVQPNGEVVTTFAIPEGYGKDVALYFIAEDGTGEKVEATVSKDGKTVSAKLKKLGSYSICKLADQKAETETETETAVEITETEDGNTALYTVLAVVAVLVIAGGVTAAVLLKKKKKA